MTAPPTTFSREVSTGSERVTVDFTLQPVRSSNFQVLVQNSSGIQSYNARASRVYLGSVRGNPGALASGLLRTDNTLVCRISFETGVEWSSTGGAATVRGSTNWTPKWPTTGTVPLGGAGSSVYGAEVGVDAPLSQYRAANSNVDDIVDITEFSITAANVVYLRDAAIFHRLGKLVVRTNQASDPYDGKNDTSLLLNEVKRQWEEVIPNVVGGTHNLALVAVPGVSGAGLGYIGTVGSGAFRYSSNGSTSNGDFSEVWRHEAGHNWGSGHYEGGGQPEGPTIMSDNTLSRFSSSELLRILAYRNTILNLLQNLGPYAFPLPPRANMATGRFSPGKALSIDLLGNDSDSNGQSFTLNSVPNKSAFGITIRNADPGKVSYTPTYELGNVTDYFSYGIKDSANNTGTGFVTLRRDQPVSSDQLAAHWTFDDGTGNAAEETTSNQNHGTVSSSGTSWTTGRVNGAVRLDGLAGYVASSDGLNLNTNSVTISAWVRRNGTQSQWAGIGMCRANGTNAGFHVGLANELRYTWDVGNNPSYRFDSKLVLPDGQWTFCALVISPAIATIYMRPAGSSEALLSATATGALPPQGFAGPFYIGSDPSFTDRRFKGDIDDVRVYRRSLTLAEIISLANDGGTPSIPSPTVKGTRIASTTFGLTWRPAPSSTSFQVFYGTDVTSVSNATTASPEFQGRTTSPTFKPSSSQTTLGDRFWRVDASDGTTTLKGPVWYFTVVPNIAGVVGWWRMDEGIGTTVRDSSGRDGNGTMTGGVTWGGGKFVSGLNFSGSGGVACGTAASLNGTTPFSVRAWVKVPTSHSSEAIIIQQRGPEGYNGEYQLGIAADGRPRFWVYGDGADQFYFYATTAIRDGQWHQIVAVRDGTAGRIYIDGTLSGSATGPLRNLDGSIPVFIGFDGRDKVQYFTGSLEEVQVLNRALSIGETQTPRISLETSLSRALPPSVPLPQPEIVHEVIPIQCNVGDDGSLPGIETPQTNAPSPGDDGIIQERI